MNLYYCEVPAKRAVRTHFQTNLPQSAVFEILNLSAALFIQSAEIVEIYKQETLDDKKRVLIEAIQKLLLQVRATGFRFLDLLRVSTSALVRTTFLYALMNASLRNLQDSARLAHILLSNTSCLQTAIKSSSYDFSVLYGISSWLRQLLRESDQIFMDIIETVDVLYNALSPSNGVGLFKIWSHLFVEECSPTVLRMVTWTDQMASSLDDVPDVASEFR
jgi:hypothetical protein